MSDIALLKFTIICIVGSWFLTAGLLGSVANLARENHQIVDCQLSSGSPYFTEGGKYAGCDHLK